MADSVGTFNFSLHLGATKAIAFVWKESADGDPVDLTGHRADMHFKVDEDFDETILELSSDPAGGLTITAASGRVDMVITPAQTLLFDCDEAVYDLLLTHTASGVITKIIQGKVVVNRTVTVL